MTSPPLPEVRGIVSGDHRHSNSVAVAVDGSEIRCGCPQGTHFLIAPGTITESRPLGSAAVSPEPVQRAQATKKKKREITLTAGVFFDGTGNSVVNTQNMLKAYTAGHYDLNDPEAESILAKCARESFGVSGTGATSYTGYYTNIYWLSTLYKKNISGNDSDVQAGLYIDGIGTEAGKPDSKLGQGFGISDTGVVAKTNNAVSPLVNAISDAVVDIQSKSGCEIVIKHFQFDIFGFSRGAAAARHFANRIQSEDPAIISAIRQAVAQLQTLDKSPCLAPCCGQMKFRRRPGMTTGFPLTGTARYRNAALRH